MVQDSGTGKSQMMKAYHNLLTALGIKSRLTVSDNEASLTGSTYLLPDKYAEVIKAEKKKKGEAFLDDDRIKKKKGLLADLFSLCWDEGSVLIEEGKFSKNMTDYFQVVMDEPGRVSKGMRLGTIEYYTDATIVAGSYMVSDFKKTLLKKGFLQRMFLYFKKFTPQEERNIRIGVALLKTRKDPKKIQDLIEAIRRYVAKIPALEHKTITFNNEAVKKFLSDLEEIYRDHIDKAFTGEKQVVLKTFYSRLHNLIDKIAAQRAMILGKSEVEYEDLEYAKKLCMKHVKSLIAIFDYLVGGELVSVPERRELIVLTILSNNNGKLIQKDLLEELRKLKKLGKWDLGWNGTLKLLSELISKNRIKVSRGVKGKKLLFV